MCRFAQCRVKYWNLIFEKLYHGSMVSFRRSVGHSTIYSTSYALKVGRIKPVSCIILFFLTFQFSRCYNHKIYFFKRHNLSLSKAFNSGYACHARYECHVLTTLDVATLENHWWPKQTLSLTNFSEKDLHNIE